MQSPILSRSSTTSSHSISTSQPEALAVNAALSSALEHGLDLPLSALRASMESIQLDLPDGAKGKRSLRGAIEKVELISRNIHDLMDLAAPPTPMPLRCTPLEIASSVHGSLLPSERARVLIANFTDDTTVHMDAPLVARCLRRLIDNAFEAQTEFVLLTLRSQKGGTSFGVVDGAPSSFDEDWAMRAFHSDKRHHMGLGLALVERDMQLLGGSFEIQHTANGETMATLLVPNEHGCGPLDRARQQQSMGARA